MRAMIPDGDRRHRAESRRIEAEKGCAERQDDVVRILVLRHDLGDLNAGRLSGAPRHQVSQCEAAGEGRLDSLERRVIDRSDGADRNGSHSEDYASRGALVTAGRSNTRL